MLGQYCDHDDSSGAGWILFGLFCFVVAAVAFWVALVALSIHAVVKGLIALTEQRYVSAVLWFGLFAVLVYASIAGSVD